MATELNSIQSFLDQVILGAEQLSIEILGENSAVVGIMRPLTIHHLDRDDIILKLTEWRNQNVGVFLTQFTATAERTRNWLEKVVFNTSGQMLFLIYWNDQLIGHLGFKELQASSALLDNAIKGERLGPPKLFIYAHRSLANWLLKNAGIQTLYGYVFADNAPAIMMNKQIGWKGWVKLPLIKEYLNGETAWKIGKENHTSPDNKYCYKITMEKKTFESITTN